MPLLLLLGLTGGQALWLTLSRTQVAWVFGMAAPFCLVCAASVWAMRSRLDEVVDTERLSLRAYGSFMRLTALHKMRAAAWAGAACMAGLVVVVPVVAVQFAMPIGQWMAWAGGFCVALSIYAHMLARYWEAQLRAFASRQADLPAGHDPMWSQC